MPSYESLVALLDGSWFDAASLGVAIGYSAQKCYRAENQRWISRATGFDIANGVAIFPLLMLSLGSLSSPALEALIASNRVILTVAGIVAIFALVSED